MCFKPLRHPLWKCSENLSQVLGTSQCMGCHIPWIALIIPLIAIAGFFLVAFLIFLNLTVSVGSINGLIFYANIVRANNAIFFPPHISDSFFNKFIAWLNLDLGIEICFYDGFDAYTKTWFQFLHLVVSRSHHHCKSLLYRSIKTQR